MRKYLFLLMAALVLVACGNDQGIVDDEFTFKEDDVINIYEDENDRLTTGVVKVDGGSINLEEMDKEETIGMLEAIGKLISDDKMSKAINTFEKDDDVSVMTDKISILIVAHEDSYSTFVFTKIEDEEDTTD